MEATKIVSVRKKVITKDTKVSANNNNGPGLKIIPLGGLHEIGKNTCVFEYEDEIMLLDAGLGFPSDDMHGINIVLPNIAYLKENRHKIKGMIVTHGHEDHIGGIAYHLRELDIPVIYGPRLALALLGDKLEEAGLLQHANLKTVLPRDTVSIGQFFKVEFIRNTHSMADSFTVAVTTPFGVVIHTGDFKFDYTPVDGEYYDLAKLAEYGEKGVLCLMSDSTNAEVPGHTASEASVYPSLDRIFSQAPGRIMVTTFASSVHRLNIVLQLALKHGRKVVVVGRSMLNVIAHARNLGYIKCPDEVFEPMKNMRRLPDDKMVILTTGSQGEPLAAMTRISNKEHRDIRVKQGDTIIFSANPIPGNTIGVVNCIDRLMIQGANVIYGRDKGIHVSGHGAQEDHKLMIALTKPKFFIPVHGEHRMLVQHSKIAQSQGIPAENMVIIDNGDVIELTENSIQVTGKVASGIELVDRAGVVHEHVMKERQQLAEDGVITIVATVSSEGKLMTEPEINLRGVVTKVERSLFEKIMTKEVERIVEVRWNDFLETNQNGETEINWTNLRLEIESSLQRLARRELQSYPLVIFLLQNIEEASDSSSPANTISRRRRRSTASVAS